MAQEALYRSEQRLLLAQAGASVGIWEWNVQTGQSYWSPETERLLGLAPGTLRSNDDWRALVHPDDLARIDAQWGGNIARREDFEVEYRVEPTPGATRWLVTKGRAQYGPDGQVVLLSGINLDVTDRKRDIERLRLSEERNRLLFDRSRDALMLTAPPSWRFIEANPATLSLFGAASLAEFTRLTPADVSPERQPDGSRSSDKAGEMIATALRDGSAFFEWEHQRLDGHRFPCDVLLTCIEGEEGLYLQASVRDITERKAAAEALRRERDLAESLVDLAQVIILLLDAQGRILRFNPYLEGISGYALAEVRGQDWIDTFVPAQDREASRRLLQDAFCGAPPPGNVNALRTRGGEERQIEWLFRTLKDEWGGMLGLLAVGHDVTERLRADQALRDSEERLRIVIATAQDAVIMIDDDGRVRLWNPAAERMFGYPAAQALGAVLHSLVAPERYRAAQAAGFAGFRATGQGAAIGKTLELVACRRDGTEFPIELSLSAVRMKDRWCAVGIVRDVTQRKQAEQELEHYRLHLEELVEARTLALTLAEERSRLILESSGDGIYGLDLEGRCTFINPAACALLGYESQDLLGRPLHDLIQHSWADGRSCPASECPMWLTLRGGQVLRKDDERFRHADGHLVPVAYSSHPIRQDGVITGAVVSFTDISARKRAEAARQEALEAAERLARLKAEFLANMSHEIRTPLNAVLGLTQIGLRDSKGSKAQGLFRRISGAGQALLGAVNDILDFSKIEAGKLTLEPGPVDLSALLSQVTEQVAERARDKGLDFRIEAAADLPASCRADGLRLSQVLGNLLSNAIKFTGQGAVTLAAAREADQLVVRVADTGIGMSSDQVARLFQPFEQADGSISRRFGGTGLGLTISKRLVDLMGGELTLRSQPGEGSVFEVRVPLEEPAGRICFQPRGLADTPPQSGEGRLHGLAILVVDDHEVNRLELGAMLNREGCRLVQASGGREAVEEVRRRGGSSFDLVLMDVQMPEMDGYEATHQILALDPWLPVVGLTAHAMPADRERCLAAGMRDHLAKPVELEDLVTLILAHARDRGGSGATARPVVVEPSAPAAEPAQGLIDWAALNARYRDFGDLLPRLLTTAAHGSAGQAAQLRDAVRAGDCGQVARIAHSVKGTAGGVLAQGLKSCALHLEEVARAGRPEAISLALGLADQLDRVIRELDAHLEAAAAGHPEPAAPDPAQVRSVLAELEPLLEISDTEAAEVFERSRGLLLAALGDQGQRLARQIEAFDFEAALVTVRGSGLGPGS